MARPGVEYDDVAQVAQQLLSQGEFPSVQKVRLRLGTGSNTTINAHLKAWQTHLASSKDSPVLPESVPEDLMNPLDEFWRLALEKAENNYHKYKEEMQAKVQAAEHAQQEAQATLEVKVQEHESLHAAYAELERQLRETEHRWHTLQGEQTITASELSQLHTTLEQAHALLQSQQQSFENERLKLTLHNAENVQFERERSSATETRLLTEIDQLRQTIKSLESERNKHQKSAQEVKELSQQRELTLQQQVAELTMQCQHQTVTIQQLQQNNDELKQQLQAVQQQFSKSLDTVEALRLALEQSKDREILLTEQIGHFKERIVRLQPED